MLTVAELIAHLQKLPGDLPIGSKETDRVGEVFYSGILTERRYVGERTDRMYEGDGPGGARQVLVLY